MTNPEKKENIKERVNKRYSTEVNIDEYNIISKKFEKVQNVNQLINLQLDYKYLPNHLLLNLISNNIGKLEITMEDFLLKNLELLNPKLKDNNKNIIKFIEELNNQGKKINIEKIVEKSCEVNNLDVLSYFMENKNYNSIINVDNKNIQNGYFLACQKGQFQIVEYLLKSPKIEKNISLYINDGHSLVAAKYQNQLIEFFIIGMNMEKNEKVEKLLDQHNGCYAQKLFNIRDRYNTFKSKYIPLNEGDGIAQKSNLLKP